MSVQAFDNEEAQFRLSAQLTTPRYIPPAARCDRLTFACANDSARASWDQAGPPAPPPSRLALAYIASARRGSLTYDEMQTIISDAVTSRAVSAGVLVLLTIVFCLFYRSWRFRRRLLYRVPHDNFI